MKIKKGDTVLIISGKDRNKTGKILNVFNAAGTVVVEGLNQRTKHIRPKRSGEKGQTIKVPVPLNVSNVKLICSKCGKASRTGYKKEGDKKYRICKKCGQEN
ncbi:MAG: 50S ribosomal protein L24 [Candidatus Staskawiczbacteria bacterium]|jgi:large subunit ribosomal protein L24